MKDKYRDDLSTKLSTYLTDAADTAIPTPGAKERAFMNMGTERGTILGEALRAIMQLKGFPITYVSKGMSGAYYVNKQLGGSSRSGVFGVAQMMVGTTMMGYLSVSLKDILSGREPMEVFDEDYYLNLNCFLRRLYRVAALAFTVTFCLVNTTSTARASRKRYLALHLAP